MTHLMNRLKRLTVDCGLGLLALVLVFVLGATGDAAEGRKPLPVESFADNSIVDRLVREGFVDKLDSAEKPVGTLRQAQRERKISNYFNCSSVRPEALEG